MKFSVIISDSTSFENIMNGVLCFLPRIGETLNIRGCNYQIEDITYEMKEGSWSGQKVYLFVRICS